MKVAIIGGGPAGLRAAEVLAESGRCAVTVFESQPSVGRKFLVAGRGGLNLTHSEPLEKFSGRYEGGDWPALLGAFSSDDLRQWVGSLGVETFVGTSGRVFPMGKQSARLLRRWVARLRELGVNFRVRHRLEAIGEGGWLRFRGGDRQVFDAIILALGGASWPQTGSDGTWPAMLSCKGIAIQPWQPANCGWEVGWPQDFISQFEGQPLKNLAVTAGSRTVRGELLITRYGLEGGALYQLGSILRAMNPARIFINFKPDSNRAIELKSLSAPARWLVARQGGLECLRACPLLLTRPRPMDEAISSAGGLSWGELDPTLQLRKLPGVWACGEMIDWEAPTGGYLLQGCFATGTVAARGVLQRYFGSDSNSPSPGGH